MWADHEDCERIIVESWRRGPISTYMKRAIDKILAYNWQLEV